MKKILFLFACLILAVAPTRADKVDAEKAEKLAQQYARSKRLLKTYEPVRLKYVAGSLSRAQRAAQAGGAVRQNATAQQAAATDTAHYYVFNFDENAGGGFIVVAADDAVKPVLGYSVHGGYDENNLPPNFAEWMDYLQDQIAYAKANKLQQSNEIRALWDGYQNGSVPEEPAHGVPHLIQTTWDQEVPYWNLCPIYGTENTFTGCVATAMAQIMKYYEYPERGTGQSAAYTTASGGIEVPSVNLEVAYDWPNMLNSYSGSSTSQQQTAVATLMYHCGVSVQMDYGTSGMGGSGAYSINVPNAMTTHFGYDEDIQYKYRYLYSTTDWETMLRDEINAGRPVYYTGHGSGGGHAFICDGYDDDGKFHFNWGWSGYYNGYFVSSTLNPGGNNFNQNQTIIVNINPGERYDLALYNEFSSTHTGAAYDETFTVSVGITNSGAGIFPGGHIGIALENNNGDVEEIVGSTTMAPLDGSLDETFQITCSVSNAVSAGPYKLRAAYRISGGDWTVITSASGCPDYIDFRAGLSNNANLQSLSIAGYSISPAFASNVVLYTLSVPETSASVTVEATAEDVAATVSGTGNRQLTIGTNTVDVTVTAENGARKTYTVTIVRGTTPVLSVPFTEDFENGIASWNFANGNQTNKWTVGTATAASGTYSAYVSNDGGVSNAYISNAALSIVHLFCEVDFAVATTACYELSFDWKGDGESTYDYMEVRLADIGNTPQAGTRFVSGTVVGRQYFNKAREWNNAVIELPASFYGTHKQLVITWINDNSGGTQPPAAIDNIKITAQTSVTLPYGTEFDGSLDGWKSVVTTGIDEWKWSNDQTYDWVLLESSTKANGYAIFNLVREGGGPGSNPSVTALLSPYFDFSNLAPTAHLALSFEHAVRGYTTPTTIKVQASTDNFASDVSDVWSVNIGTNESVSAYPQIVDLSAFVGEPLVRLRFLYTGGAGYGWLIDDVNIYEVTTNDPALISADCEHVISREGENAVFTATVANKGLLASNVQVQFSVDGQNLMETIPLLEIGATATVTAVWPNCTAGLHEVTITLPNDDDNSNNSLSFKKAVASTAQLAEGFEIGSFPPSGWSDESGQWSRYTNYVNLIYEGNRIAAIDINRGLYANAKLITPRLNVASGDKLVFYGRYNGTPSGNTPTVQILYSADKTNWTSAGAPVALTDKYGLYDVDLNVTGNYYLAISATGAQNGDCYTFIDHVIAPEPITGTLVFNITDESNRAITDAVVILDGVSYPSGNYSFNSICGTHDYRVSREGYANVSGSVIVTQGITTETVTLPSCPAVSVFPWIENFENGIPGCFNLIDGNCGWQAGTNGGSEVFVVPAHDGAYAYVNDDRCGNGADMSDVWMKLPVMDFSGIGYPELSFDNLRKTATETFTVKISTDGGNTWTDEAVYTNNTNKWQTETVNLTAYAGRPDVRIAFHYNDGGKWGYGWAVDNIKVRTPKTIPYSTEFDNSMDDWKGVTITGTDNWKWSNDQAYNYIRFKSSSKANGYAMFDLIRNGEGGSNPSETALVSPLFDFSSVASSSFIAMSFEHAARGYATSTTLRVQASTDDFVGDIRTVWTTTIPSQTYASGYPQFVDLSAFAGEPTVRLRFLYSGGRAYGWLIDDINIREVTTIDVAIADADSEHTISREGDGVTLKAIVRNHGILASNIPVQFSVNGQNFMATVPLLSIGDTATVTVTWPNSTAGVHDINVTLPNDSDNSNNSLSFKKVVATTTQLTEGFERTIFPPHGWTNESGLWTQDTYASSVYEGTKYATIGGNNITFTNAKLITPKLNIAAGDKFVFYGEYYGTPASAPTVQIMYSGDKTNWLPVRTPLTMTDEYGLYVVDLNITGTYYLAIGATGTNCYVDIDHVIAPVPVTGALTFVVLDENNRPVNNATITLNETTNPAGNYSFTDLIYETYNYRVSSDRYADVSGTITIATGSTTKSVTLRSCPVISSFPWTEDFENGMSECFKLIDGDCGWQVGTDGGGSGFNIPAHDGAYAYANDDRCGNSKNMNDVWMKLLIMDFTELISPELMFDNYRRWDRCVIKVSTDGSTWTDEAVYTGILSLWRTETVDLSAYAGQPAVYVAFRYSDGGSWGYGWAVDNITVKEKDSFDATLSSLSVAGHVISPVFDPYITDYTLNVPYSVDEVEINATVAQSAANIVTGTGTTALIVGTNTCDIVVLAPDGITSKTYTVAITRAAPSGDATLSEITLSTGLLNPLFGPTTTAYTVNLEYSVQHISVTGTANHIAATVVGNGFYPLSIGDNIITLTVTAENGTTQTYKITVVRDVTPSNDATLKSLILSEGTLDPVFNPDTTAYTVDVAYVITNIIVTGTKNHDKATVAGNASYPLSIGGNFISITVTAEDGTIRTYAITVVRAAPSDDATLNTLTVNPGTLEPAFNSSTKDYTVEVANNVTSVSVNYTTNHANARVVVTGTPGNLSVGDNLVSVTVTAEDGTTLETYTVRIKRAPSDDATLNALTVNPGTLDPAFNSSTKDYAVEVANNVTSVSVNYTTNHTNARVAVTGTPGNLSVGDNLVTLAVTAEDGTTIETYTVTINRAPSDDASLNALTINPGTLEPAFNSSTKDYAVEVANNVTSVNVIYTTNHANARVVVTGTSGNLSVGDNFVTLTVTAEDGTTIEIYTIRINRAPSDDATLRALTVSAGTLVFDPATTEYTVDVANEVRNISVGGTATHENANVAGRVTDEPLAVGNNVVTLTVTAEDRTTIKTYTVTINRAPSNEADLVEISVNDNEIYVDELVYQANCGEVSVILALKISEAANVKVNGSAYGGGAIPLSGDVTNITISVIPESGASEFTNNFTLKVVSAFSDNRLYHQRWDDVLAVNMNPAENGSRNITAVRWYDNQGFLVGTGEYIALSGLVNPNDYHAEIEINGNRHIVCHSSGTRVASRVFAFPNPVPQGESLTLELTKAYIDGTLNIYTVSGGMVKQNIRLYSNTVSVSAEGLEKGIYLFIVTAKTGETQTVKIIIN